MTSERAERKAYLRVKRPDRAGDARLSYANLADYARQFPDMAPEHLAKQIVAQMSEKDLRAFAQRQVASLIEHQRRQAVREREWEAQADRERLLARREEEQRTTRLREEKAAQEAEEHASFTALRDYPLVAYQSNWSRNPEGAYRLGRREERENFRHWMGEAFETWYASTHAQFAHLCPKPLLEKFESDWHPSGAWAYAHEKMIARIYHCMEEYAAELRLELTRELLESRFARGDGTDTTWGEASLEEHRQRRDALIKHAAGTTETAARHHAAITMLEQRGAQSLNEIAGRAP